MNTADSKVANDYEHATEPEQAEDAEIDAEIESYEVERGPAYTDADEALRRYRANPSPTPAPAVSENVRRAEVTEDHVVFYLDDGRFVGVPLVWSWRLLEATKEERQDFEISPSGYGVRWPAVDEDLSERGALRGRPAPRPDAKREPRPKTDDEPGASWTAPRIKQLRRRMGLSQADFAERMGVRQATVSNWENANQEPASMACRLLDQLAMTPHARR